MGAGALAATVAALLLVLSIANSLAATPDEVPPPTVAPPAAREPAAEAAGDLRTGSPAAPAAGSQSPAPPEAAAPPAPPAPREPAAEAAGDVRTGSPAAPAAGSQSPAPPEAAAPPAPPTDTAPPETPPAPPAPTTLPDAGTSGPPAPTALPDAGTSGPPAPPRKPLEGPILLNFKDASVRAVLEYLSEAAGLVIVEEATVDGRVTVMSRQPLSVEEAVSLLNSILKAKGFAAIRTGRTLKIMALDQAKKAALPVRSGIDPEQIEPTDQLVTYVIPIRSADAVQLRRDLATLIPSYADLSANASTNTLILTDTEMNVRRFVEIIRALDTQTASVSEVRVYQLKFANAANAARLINDLFKQDQSTQGGSPFSGIRQFMFGGGPGGGGPPFGGGPRSDSGERGFGGDSGDRRHGESRDQPQGISGGRPQQQKVTASSDDRTNTLVVSGPPELLRVIDDIISKLDSNPSEEQAVFVYPLKNALAANIESVLNNLFGWSGGTSGRTSTTPRQGTTSTSPFQRGTGSSSRSTGGSGFGSSGFSSRSSGGLGSSGFGSSGFGSSGAGTSGFFGSGASSGFSGRGTTRISPTTASSASDLAGQVYVVADPDTNSLLVTADSKHFDKIKEILADLDRPVPQVLIKVLIAEVTHEDTLDLGAEFSALNMNAAGTKGQRYSTDFSVAAQTGGLIVRVLENDVTAAIRVLAGVGKLDVLSRPYILTSDNQQASIMVGQEVPFITRSQLTDTGQTINTIEYDNIGIILTVTPHINPEGLVIMDVYPEISALTGTTVPISETVNAPVFARRAAQSRVAIRDGQTIVIGGLMEDRNTENVQKVPLLGDIPWLGALFRRTTQDKIKTELLIFLTPHVAKVPDDLKQMAADEQAGAKVVRDAVESGAFDDHMKGMQRGAIPPQEGTEGGPRPGPNDHDQRSP